MTKPSRSGTSGGARLPWADIERIDVSTLLPYAVASTVLRFVSRERTVIRATVTFAPGQRGAELAEHLRATAERHHVVYHFGVPGPGKPFDKRAGQWPSE